MQYNNNTNDWRCSPDVPLHPNTAGFQNVDAGLAFAELPVKQPVASSDLPHGALRKRIRPPSSQLGTSSLHIVPCDIALQQGLRLHATMSIRPFPPGKECLDFMKDGAQPVPDSDISGLGVILAFTVSAYLTFALVLASYLFGQVDGSLLNTVDTQVFHVRPFRPLRTHNDKPTRLRVSQALRQAILALSDQQIVTGIAILGAGFQGLRLGGIDSYHYQTVIYLAWMSSSVHLSALAILAPILKERPALRTWRLVGMLVLLVLLIIALIPTASNDWGLLTWEGMASANSGWGVPAICFWATT